MQFIHLDHAAGHRVAAQCVWCTGHWGNTSVMLQTWEGDSASPGPEEKGAMWIWKGHVFWTS